MADFGVTAQKEAALRHKMQRLAVREQDLIEHFVRSGGKGGQNVNKVSSCVYLRHIPTGIEVKCQSHRSQALNRWTARVLLASKIENLVMGRYSEERRRIEKLRRQKRRRSKRAKLKMLEAKVKHSRKKLLRLKVAPKEYEIH